MNKSNTGAGIWRTPAEKKAAQGNAKNLFEESKRCEAVVMSTPYQSSELSARSGILARQWVAFLHMNCYAMWYMLLPAFVDCKPVRNEYSHINEF